MSDSDNYFSDSDKSERDEDEISSDIENDQESSDDEMDEETRQIIYRSLMQKKDNSIESFCRPSDVPVHKKKKVKERKSKNVGLSLSDFQKKIDESKPKKWKSKRFQDRKNDLGMADNKQIKKRQFNPRLPPPTYKTFKKEEEEEVLTNSEEAFPSLSDTFKDITV